MTLSPLLLRVAAALKAQWHRPETWDCSDDEYGISTADGGCADTQALARAVLEAMREPTAEMENAGVAAEFENSDDYRPTRVWRAMIAAALGEKQ